MLCGRIAEDAITATESGTEEKTAAEVSQLVSEFIRIVSEDSTSSEATTLMTQIESAKITVKLTNAEIAMTYDIISKLEVIVVDITNEITVTSGTTTTFSEYKTAAESLVTEISSSSTSSKILSLSLTITSAMVTLSTDEITEITTIKESLQTQIVMIEKDLALLQTSIKEVTGEEASEDQIAVGDEGGEKSELVEESIATLKTVVQHTTIITKVTEMMTLAIAGTATSGTVTVTSSEFVTLVEAFMTVVNTDVLDASIITMSASITTISVTLTTADITTITSQKTTLETVITQLVSMKEVLQLKIESVSGTTANPTQILSGSLVASKEIAIETILIEMKELTMTSKVGKVIRDKFHSKKLYLEEICRTENCLQAVTSVTETLTTVISGGSSSGTEMTSTAFISVVSEFLSVTQLDFVSVKITSLALTIITAKVIREAQSYQNS